MGSHKESSNGKGTLAKWGLIGSFLISFLALVVSCLSLGQSRSSNEIAKQALDATTVNVETFGYPFIAEDPKMSAPSDEDFLSRRGVFPLFVSSELWRKFVEGPGDDTEQLYAFAMLENLGPSRMLELEVTDVQCRPTVNETLDGWHAFSGKIGLLKPSQAVALLVHVMEGTDRFAAYELLPCNEITITFTYIDIFNESHEGFVSIDTEYTVEMFDFN